MVPEAIYEKHYTNTHTHTQANIKNKLTGAKFNYIN